MRRCVLALFLPVVAAGCGGGEGTTAAAPVVEPPDAPADVVVTVERSRLFEQQRTLAVTVENRGPDRVSLVDPWLDSGRHAVVDAPSRVVTVDAGRRLTFPLPYGAARCGDVGDVVTVHAEIEGSPARFEAPVTDPIAGAHGRECAAERARAAVELDFADDWTVDGAVASGTLTVRSTGPDVAVVDVRTAIVFVASTRSPLPASSDVRLVISAQRCDVHALIESKKTFTVAVHVRVGDERPVPVEIVADDGPVRAALDQALAACVAVQAAG